MTSTALVILAHAPLASALKAVATHVYPECGATVHACDVAAGESPAEVERSLAAQLSSIGDQEVLLLCDVFGATPCNIAQRLSHPRRIRVVTGVNVPMLWRVLCYRDDTLDRLAERALSGATSGVMAVDVRPPQFQESRANKHGQGFTHDQ